MPINCSVSLSTRCRYGWVLSSPVSVSMWCSLIDLPYPPQTVLASALVTSSDSPIALPTSRIAMRGR